MKKLYLRQVCFIILAFLPMTKIIFLPAFTSYFVGRDLWLSLILNLSIDFLLILSLLYVIKRENNTSFYNLINDNLGKYVANIIYIAYALYFIFKAVMPIIEHKSFVEIALYETSPKLTTFLPFFICAFYLAFKGFNTLGRMADILMPLSVLAFILILFLSFGSSDLTSLLPIGKSGIGKILSTSFYNQQWFSTAPVLLILMGNFENKKNTTFKISISFIISSLLVILFFVIFYGVFQYVSPRKLLALAKISKYTLALSDIGRVDFIAIFILTATSVVAISIPLILSVECLAVVFGNDKRFLYALISTSILFIIIVCIGSKVQPFITFSMNVGIYIYCFMGYLLPLLALFLRGKNPKRDLTLPSII